jgi:antitoxin ParD1/3/4
MDKFVISRVKTGRYSNASEVMRTALRLLERDEKEFEQKMKTLREAIAVGDKSGDAEDGVFERLYDYIDELEAAKVSSVAKV